MPVGYLPSFKDLGGTEWHQLTTLDGARRTENPYVGGSIPPLAILEVRVLTGPSVAGSERVRKSMSTTTTGWFAC
jgi:hypothetical protein